MSKECVDCFDDHVCSFCEDEENDCQGCGGDSCKCKDSEDQSQ